MAKHGLWGKTRPSFHHIWDKVSKLKHCSFPWFCSSMSLNPAALNHHICLRGLSSTRPAHTNTFTFCKTYSGFHRPVFRPVHIKVRRNISPGIPAGDKLRKAPYTRSVFLLFSSSPAGRFRPTALQFQILSCLSRKLAGLQATKHDVNKLDWGSFHICFRPQVRGVQGPHTSMLSAHPSSQSGSEEAAISNSVWETSLWAHCKDKNPQISLFACLFDRDNAFQHWYKLAADVLYSVKSSWLMLIFNSILVQQRRVQ